MRQCVIYAYKKVQLCPHTATKKTISNVIHTHCPYLHTVSVRDLDSLLGNDAIRLQLVQLVRAADVVGIQCRVEEIT
jgi:hypothetical protein